MYNHQLDAFVCAAEAGSFGKAAEAMFISAPAMIQQINLLEARCGVKLFTRSHQGVQLTAAGQSLYEDAKTIIKLSEDALGKARRISENTRSTVRIGTSLLFKCRLFPDLWSRISGICPDLKIEILPLPEQERHGHFFQGLGTRYDLVEGVYGDIAYRGLCDFLELRQTPLCCAVSRRHPLAQHKAVKMADLDGGCLVMPVAGISRVLDAFRQEIGGRYPATRILDSAYYGVDTFALCEVNPYILITQQVYADIHPNLVKLPLESGYTMPYGLLYAKSPSAAAKRFVEAAAGLSL